MPKESDRPLIVANCSGFYGDKLSAAKELVDGGPIDVLTGDYLAELTMAILFRQKMKDPSKGYVGTFLKQIKEVLSDCLDKKIKIVCNAGGLNPKAMADAIREIANQEGLSLSIAYIDGDDLMPRLQPLQKEGEAFSHIDKGTPFRQVSGMPVTANAYLGCWGIKEALTRGADVVICPRVTDAALLMGPAAWKFNWNRDDYDPLAGALAAGHIIECGTQATGGNYSFFQEVPSFRNVGFPIAEIYPDGSSIITKHPGTGGLVSVGTVTAQLMYEVSTPEYLSPDVIGHFDTLKVSQESGDRVLVQGCLGSSPPLQHKVCLNYMSGHRNGMTILITGLDVEEKAEILTDALFYSLGGKEQFEEVAVQLVRTDKPDPPTNEEAFALLRINVKAKDSKAAGRLFSAKVIELALSTIPGFGGLSLPDAGMPCLIHWPCLINSAHIVENVWIEQSPGKTEEFTIRPTNQLDLKPVGVEIRKPVKRILPETPLIDIPFGRIYGTRSGDKGGNANLGVWGKNEQSYNFLEAFLNIEKLQALLPETACLEIERYLFPNLFAVNFYIKGLLGEGVSSSFRMDPQAKTLGEYLRAKIIQAPELIILKNN